MIVADLSRLARNVVDRGTTIAALQQIGIVLVSVEEAITDDTAPGKLARSQETSIRIWRLTLKEHPWYARHSSCLHRVDTPLSIEEEIPWEADQIQPLET